MCAKNQAPITIFTKVGARQKFGNFWQKPGFPEADGLLSCTNYNLKHIFSFVFELYEQNELIKVAKCFLKKSVLKG